MVTNLPPILELSEIKKARNKKGKIWWLKAVHFKIRLWEHANLLILVA